MLKSIEDYGFHNPPDYVTESFETWYLTEYRVMPRAGGWDDQDYYWRQDMRQMLRIMSANRYTIEQGRALGAVGAKPEQKKQSWADSL